MNDRQTARGVIQNPETSAALSYEAICTRVGDEWHWVVEFDDGQWRFGLEEPVKMKTMSLSPDVAAHAALPAYNEWK